MESAQCHAGYGEGLLGVGKSEAGIRQLIEAVNIRPSAVYLEKLGDGYALSAHDFNQAAVAYTMAMDQDKNNAALRLKYLRTLIQAGSFADAERTLDEERGRTADHPMTVLCEAMLRWKQGNIQAYQRLLNLLGTHNPGAPAIAEHVGC
jgi:thioredoxin-like negative regulator of GroEL